MKRLTAFILLLGTLVQSHAQVVFCPSGAEWSYNYKNTMGGAPGAPTLLTKITYQGDSLFDGFNCKVLKHGKMFLECGDYQGELTFIRQAGDTIYMRNSLTMDSWQILYNFAALPGQSWQTVLMNNFSSAVLTYSVGIDSVKTILENNIPLKRLFAKFYMKGQNGFYYSHSASISERFGSSLFLFSYYNITRGWCDHDWFQRFLCYKDNGFGTKVFTSFPCDFQNPLGENSIARNQTITARQSSPNEILVQTNSDELYVLSVMDLSGRIVLESVTQKSQTHQLNELSGGIYIGRVRHANAEFQFKVIK